ncbi:iron-sulfur cluster biosynthesis family protein [Caldalkalibacillus salinus]|uniref:iron-sulfur cluster biosynthesis family protein n=1 Tax=Caldalkalibacillus salinus TaxID=2803787 RepID=UPI0019237302
MEIKVTRPAFSWFKKEMALASGDYVRFFTRYGGCGTFQSGFSLGMNKDQPKEMGAETEIDGITFYVEKEDLWYFDGHDLTVKYSKKRDEIEFKHEN